MELQHIAHHIWQKLVMLLLPNKSITSKLHSIIQKCIANNTNANTKIQKLGNLFFKAQQMVTQLVYFVLPLPLYHSFWTFQFINTFCFEKCIFVLKPQVALNELKLDPTNIMCSSIIKIYINHPNQYESLSLVEFNYFYKIKKIKFQNIANPKLLGL
jgi:hypothetical protein